MVVLSILELILLLVIISMMYFRYRALPGVSKAQSRRMILDSCALIDGRILDLSNAGFVPTTLIVPEFVLHELQMLADGTDSHKRDRARFGLDVVHRLQENNNCVVSIDSTSIDKALTDDMLVALAERLNAPLYTTDYNLSKVAEIKGVRVLNVNELAQSLRPSALPGERKTVTILQKGSNPNQGVGYLEDGTMVVVENAAKYKGKKLDITVTRVHQTISGKMMFGEIAHAPRHTVSVSKNRQKNNSSRGSSNSSVSRNPIISHAD